MTTLSNPYEVPGYELPTSPKRNLWRYMKIERFQELLSTSKLYFAAVSEFDDLFEGAISYRTEGRKHPYDLIPGFSSVEEDAMDNHFRELAWQTKASCWHLSGHECAAMWQIYAPMNKGVAVVSTVGGLMTALGEYVVSTSWGRESIRIGRVKYRNYRKNPLKRGDLFYRFLHKRIYYRFEKEVRAIIPLRLAAESGERILKSGVQVKVDLNKLIKRVFVAPGQSELIPDVKNVLTSVGLDVPVTPSKMDGIPRFG